MSVHKIRVKTPATSANLGSGFDCIGLAIDLFDVLDVWFCAEGDNDNLSTDTTFPDQSVKVVGRFCDVPQDETNLVYKLIKEELDRLNCSAKFAILCENNIPHARGLGSSSAAICSALAAAQTINSVLKNEKLDDEELKNNVFLHAAEIEGHVDNVAPCVFGGVQMKMDFNTHNPGGLESSAYGELGALTLLSHNNPNSQSLKLLILICEEPVSTSEARQLLPDQINRQFAVSNISNATQLVTAFSMLDKIEHISQYDEELIYRLLYSGTEDFIHQEFRESAYPSSFSLVRKLRENSFATAISGAGSCVIAFLKNSNFEQRYEFSTQIASCFHPRFRPRISHISSGLEVIML